MLGFGILCNGETIEIACDQDGLNLLIQTLERLRGADCLVHLGPPSYLSEQTPLGDLAVREVVISVSNESVSPVACSEAASEFKPA